MLLRALRCAGDPVNYQILERLAELDEVNAADLMPKTGLDRVAVCERLNDLAQVGLISQDVLGGQYEPSCRRAARARRRRICS